MYAAQIRELRKKLGYTQMHLAQIANLDVKTVNRAEAGHRISGETLLALCDALQTTPAALNGDETSTVHRSDLPVIRSGSDTDQVALIPEFQRSVRDIPGLAYLVLPRQYTPLRMRDDPMGRMVLAVVALAICGGSAAAVKSLQEAAVEIVQFDLLSPLGILLFLVLVVVIVIGAGLFPAPNRAANEEDHIRPLNRAYAVGHDRFCDLRIVDDKITCETYGIDPRVPIHRSRSTWRGNPWSATYDIPVAGGRFALRDCPMDDKLDRLLVREDPKAERRDIPRSPALAASSI
jgi:transcriptional regulator with XRE-family HTH domain